MKTLTEKQIRKEEDYKANYLKALRRYVNGGNFSNINFRIMGQTEKQHTDVLIEYGFHKLTRGRV